MEGRRRVHTVDMVDMMGKENSPGETTGKMPVPPGRGYGFDTVPSSGISVLNSC